MVGFQETVFLYAPMKLYSYILRRHWGPFVFSLTTLVFVFLLQFIMRFIDELVGKGLGFWVISELIVMNLAWMVVLAVPMSVLVATLMAFGGLASHNEITAMRSSGMSLYRMMAPVFIAAILLTLLLIEFNNKVLPEANHHAKTLMIDIRRKKPTLTLSPGLFSQEIPGYSILVRKTFEQSNDLEGITIYDYTNPSVRVVITAERGTVSFTSDYRKLVMDLANGEIHELGVTDQSLYRRMQYEKHRIIMNAEGFEFERTREGGTMRGDRELSAQAMQTIVDSLQRENSRLSEQGSRIIADHLRQLLENPSAPVRPGAPRTDAISAALARARYLSAMIGNSLPQIEYNRSRAHEFLVEIHKKYAIPVACLVFVLLGAPLGVMARRGGFGVAATLSLGFFVLYWACLIGGEKLADRGFITPFWGMWFANIVLGIAGAYLTLRMGRESLVIRWNALERFKPKAWRIPETEPISEDTAR